MKAEERRIRESVEAAAEEMADALVAWRAEHPAFTLSELEEVLLGLRETLGKRVAEETIGTHGEQRPVPGPECSECGREMQYKEAAQLQHTSQLGSLEIERGYYYCPHCKCGVFPPG